MCNQNPTYLSKMGVDSSQKGIFSDLQLLHFAAIALWVTRMQSISFECTDIGEIGFTLKKSTFNVYYLYSKYHFPSKDWVKKLVSLRNGQLTIYAQPIWNLVKQPLIEYLILPENQIGSNKVEESILFSIFGIVRILLPSLFLVREAAIFIFCNFIEN